jgi:hypothetical protein
VFLSKKQKKYRGSFVNPKSIGMQENKNIISTNKLYSHPSTSNISCVPLKKWNFKR